MSEVQLRPPFPITPARLSLASLCLSCPRSLWFNDLEHMDITYRCNMAVKPFEGKPQCL